MASELVLNFISDHELVMQLGTAPARKFEFVSPFSTQDLKDLQEYVETYPTQYGTDIDDRSANQIREKLEGWGAKLYEAITASRESSRMFDQFLGSSGVGRKLTISANQVSVLGLPWEMLYVPGRDYLFNEEPSVSIRRSFAGGEGYGQAEFSPKSELRLLFVVSRPDDVGILDHRSEAKAVMDAIDDRNVSGISVEFLRPATLENLRKRLADRRLPAIDILHFDGHGAFSAGVGALCFEDERGRSALVDAKALGRVLNQRVPGLIVLSACKSSMVSGDDALGSIAVQLSQKGASSVIAMRYSVLAITTQLLFGEFYERLVSGMSVGESLDEARRRLILKTERGERVRNGIDRIELKLEDWFVPTLYQSGVDRGMVDPNRPPAPNSGGAGMQEFLGEPIAGFWGRGQDLGWIERAFVGVGGAAARRVTISGFGGQGKTALAIEVGRWLWRSGMFEAVCFVDYAGFQGVDAVALAVSSMAVQVGENFIDGAAVRGWLAGRRVLVILDNLEDVADEGRSLLLTAAVGWSEAGGCRVLVTTRQGELGHSGYAVSGSFGHRQLALTGLGTVGYPDDAIDLCKALWSVPSMLGATLEPMPVRSALVSVLEQVAFHPLSIKLVVEQLKLRRVAAVGQALERLLAAVPIGQSKDRCLIASLNLSLERLGAEEREWVKRLGVFVGGAFEDDLLAITEFTAEQWGPLRVRLEGAGLVTVEVLPNISVPYLKFHPTLAPVLWGTLEISQQELLKQRHQERYYALSRYLYNSDQKNPIEARSIAKRELPNLMKAVRSALDAADENAVDFVNQVNWFLDYFGMNHDRKMLTDRAETIAGAVGSRSWYLSRSSAGEQLLDAGRLQDALNIFEEVLNGLGTEISYDRCTTLQRIGRCWESGGQSDRAAKFYRQALGELGELEPSEGVKRQMGTVLADLGDVLTDLGDYGEARLAYEALLAIKLEIGGDDRGAAVVNGQLGTLALMEGKLPEAQQRYREALTQFQTLGEPASEANFWHQLGMAYQKSKAWDAAQEAYRKSAEIKEQQGNLAGAAKTWNQLAIVLQNTGKFQEAEAYYRKAIDADRKVGNVIEIAKHLSNLADLLQTQGGDLSEVRQLAEEALGIKRTIDPAAAQIWTTYTILAKIAIQQGDQPTAGDYRRQARQSYAAFAGSQHELQQHEALIQGVVVAIQDSSQLPELESQLQSYLRAVGWGDLVAAIRRILMGERDEDGLCEDLDGIDSLIVGEVLKRLGANS